MANTSNNIGSISWAINASKASYTEVIAMKDWRLRKCDIRLRNWAKANLTEEKPYILATPAEIAALYEMTGNAKMAEVWRSCTSSKKGLWRISDSVASRRNGRRVLDIQPVR